MDLTTINLFSDLKPEDLEPIKRLVVTRNYAKNAILINEGDEANAMYIINSGRVRVFVNDSEGREFTLNTMDSGEYFGELSLLDDEPRSASVIAMEKSSISIIYKEDFNKALMASPSIAISLLKNLSHRVRSLTDNAKTLALQDVYGRIRKTLITLAEPEEDYHIIREKLTQQEIANRIGSSREMVARILKDLQLGGYIESEKKSIRILKKLPESY